MLNGEEGSYPRGDNQWGRRKAEGETVKAGVKTRGDIGKQRVMEKE